MPIFDFEVNGKTYEIEASDMQHAVEASRKAFPPQQPQEQEPQEAPATLEGTAKAFGTGVKQGVIGLAGLPADAIYGARWLARKAGLPTVETPLPGSEEIGAAVNKVIPDYQPQNTLEEYAATTGAFAPAIASGPGGIARKALGTAATGLATETVGQTLRATAPEYEQVGRIVTALATGTRAAAKKPPVVGPSTGDWLTRAQSNYNFLDRAGVGFSTQAMDRLKTGLRNALYDKNYDPDFHTVVNDFLKLIDKKAGKAPFIQKPGSPPQHNQVKFSEWQNVRTDAGTSIGASAKDRRFLGPVKETLDDFWASLTPRDMLVNGLPPTPAMAQAAAKAAGVAKRAYFMGKKGELLDRIEKSIANRASQYSVSGMENALRTEMRGLSKRIAGTTNAARLLRGTFTRAEQKRIDQMASHVSLAGIARTLGKYNLSSAIVSGSIGTGSIIGYLLSGDSRALYGLGLLGAGSAARAIGGRSAKRQWRDFSARAKGGNQLPRSAGQLAQPLLRAGAANRPPPEDQ